jgi:hypothetical protein
MASGPVVGNDRILTGPAAESALADGLAASWSTLMEAGVLVVALRDTPRPGLDVPECVFENFDRLTACAVPRSEALAGIGAPQELATAAMPEVPLLNLNELICPAEECAPAIGDVIVYATPITSQLPTPDRWRNIPRMRW